MHFIITILLFSAINTGRINGNSIDMAVDYFDSKAVKMVCLLTCRDKTWMKTFTEKASGSGILTSADNGDVSCMDQKNHAVGVVFDIHCSGAYDVLYKASEDMQFNDQHKWLIFEESNASQSEYNFEDLNVTVTSLGSQKEVLINSEELPKSTFINYAVKSFPTITIEALLNLNLSINADVKVAVLKDNSYYLFDVYNFGKNRGGTLKVAYAGFWSLQNGLKVLLTGYKYYQRWNFERLKMRIICVMLVRPKVFYPKLLLGREYTPGVAAITKISSMVLEVIREVHNISFIYTITDRWIGSPMVNSSRVVSNSLHFREQDITPCIRLASHLLKSLDPIFPSTASIETKFFYRIPTYGLGKLENEFGRPYSFGSWIGVGVALILCGATLHISATIERRPSPTQYAVFTVVAAICQQFYDDNTRKSYETSARKLASLVTGTTCLLLYNYYTSSVVSWLLNGPAPSINSVAELIESPLELFFEDVGYTRSWLQTPGYYYNPKNAIYEDQLRKTKLNLNSNNQPLKDLEEGIELVRTGGHAYHTEPYNANMRISRTFTQSELCELGALQMMEKTPVFTATQHRSPFKEFFTWSLIRAYERGHVSCVQRRVSMPMLGCEDSIPRALALGGAAPAFLLLTFGFTLASVLLIAERTAFRLLSERKLTKFQIPYLD